MVMPRIVFRATRLGREKVVEVPGGELLDICDHFLAPIPFSCRSASCGTCHVHVPEGASLLEPPDPEEQELLDLLGGLPNHRLACQARVKDEPGTVVIEPVLGQL
jgi:ferredoxin